MAAMLAYGFDMYHAALAPPGDPLIRFGSGAGQHLGKFPPLALAAALEVGNTARQNAVKAVASWVSSNKPQEFAQLQDGPYGPVWGDLDAMAPVTRYWNDYQWAGCYDNAPGPCNPNVGTKAAADPHGYIDGPANRPGEFYFQTGYAGILNFAASCILIPAMQALVIDDKHILFVHRAKTHGLKTLPDPCVNIDSREDMTTCNVWTGGTGCDYYWVTAAIEKTWGPKSLYWSRNLGCGDTPTEYAVQSRFGSMDGTPAPINSSHVVAAFNSNWSTIYSEYPDPPTPPPGPVCATNPNYCLDGEECLAVDGYYWCSGTCQDTTCDTPVITPKAYFTQTGQTRFTQPGQVRFNQ
jgi:hypothetical protein